MITVNNDIKLWRHKFDIKLGLQVLTWNQKTIITSNDDIKEWERTTPNIMTWNDLSQTMTSNRSITLWCQTMMSNLGHQMIITSNDYQ